MGKWSDSPPTPSEGYGLRLLRTPKTGKIRGLITYETLAGTPTHYWGGRTVPCETPICKACEAQIGWRWHGYVPMILPGDHEHVILELTAQACEVIKLYAKVNGSLRGTFLTAVRAAGRTNGRVLLHLEPSDLQSIVLPEEPDVPKVMRHIWGIQADTQAVITYAEDRGAGFRVIRNEKGNGKVLH